MKTKLTIFTIIVLIITAVVLLSTIQTKKLSLVESCINLGKQYSASHKKVESGNPISIENQYLLRKISPKKPQCFVRSVITLDNKKSSGYIFEAFSNATIISYVSKSPDTISEDRQVFNIYDNLLFKDRVFYDHRTLIVTENGEEIMVQRRPTMSEFRKMNKVFSE